MCFAVENIHKLTAICLMIIYHFKTYIPMIYIRKHYIECYEEGRGESAQKAMHRS